MKIVQIEKLRMKCVETLSSKVSDRIKLRTLVRFFNNIGGEAEFDLRRSYYLEFSSSLFSLINEYSIIHSDPEYLLRISDLLSIYSSRFQKICMATMPDTCLFCSYYALQNTYQMVTFSYRSTENM